MIVMSELSSVQQSAQRYCCENRLWTESYAEAASESNRRSQWTRGFLKIDRTYAGNLGTPGRKVRPWPQDCQIDDLRAA